jgi:hypothetical protein
MSFLTERITNYVENLIRDPAAEAKKKEEQTAIANLIKTYRPILNADVEEVLKIKDGDISDFDRAIIQGLNSERRTLLDNKAGLNPTELQNKWEDLTDKFNSLGRPKDNQFRRWRLHLERHIKTLKQCAQDVKEKKITVSAENLKLADDLQKELLKFQNDNSYTGTPLLIQKEFDSIEKRFTQQQKGDFVAVCMPSLMKLEKNKYILDFKEEGGPPVPAAVLEAKAREEELNHDKEQDTFSTWRMFLNIMNTALRVFLSLLFIFLILISASLAVNLNIYKPVPFRILYAIYGALFSFIVLPYTVFYRWIYLGKRPHYYGFLPFIPRFFIHRPIQFLFGWLTFKPDAHMWELQEWRKA